MLKFSGKPWLSLSGINYATELKSNFHKAQWNILYFGTDLFAVKPLDRLNSLRLNGSLIKNIEVVCPPEKRKLKDIKHQNKVTTVRQHAEVNGIATHDWPAKKHSYFLSKFHLGVVVSFGHFIPSWIINKLPCGAINIHPSLLPKWRGPAPLVHTLLNQDAETGVSIIEVSPIKFDAGNVLLQKKIKISGNKTYEELAQELSILSSNMIVEVLTNFTEYKASSWVQDEKKVSNAPKITKEIGHIKWSEFTHEYILRLWRVIGHKFGVKCRWNDQVVTLETLIQETSPSPSGISETMAEYGQPFYDSSKNVLYIKCKVRITGPDGWVGCRSLKVQYKKSITAKEFHNGYLIDKDTGKITSKLFQDMT